MTSLQAFLIFVSASIVVASLPRLDKLTPHFLSMATKNTFADFPRWCLCRPPSFLPLQVPPLHAFLVVATVAYRISPQCSPTTAYIFWCRLSFLGLLWDWLSSRGINSHLLELTLILIQTRWSLLKSWHLMGIYRSKCLQITSLSCSRLCPDPLCRPQCWIFFWATIFFKRLFSWTWRMLVLC